ncbi:MAG: hypothetical protein LBQ28_06530 [Prevotellaceae bacterium]|jgi:hypothetical protein|nr:hypothetical protein [Prevotellaceae bacterium]
MKNILKLTAILLILAGSFSCGEDDNEKNILSLQNIEKTLCDGNSQDYDVKSLNNASEDKEYLRYFAIDKQTLKFEQQFFSNCCVENIEIDMVVSKNNVVINLRDYGEECNCICLSYVDYEITNLQENNAYTFTFQRNAQTYYSCEIIFTTDIDETIYFQESRSLLFPNKGANGKTFNNNTLVRKRV